VARGAPTSGGAVGRPDERARAWPCQQAERSDAGSERQRRCPGPVVALARRGGDFSRRGGESQGALACIGLSASKAQRRRLQEPDVAGLRR
jgi:hypothetical protein